jgi:transposase
VLRTSYVGYCLQRDLISNGVHCDIVSPSSIPSPRGKAIKTDRIDAGYLAQFYANDLLTIVQTPDEEQEQDRDLLRSRQKVMQQRNQLRKHLQSVLRRSGLHYKAETGNKSHWTKHHYCWLDRTIDGLYGSLKVNLGLLLRQLKALNEVLTEYGQQIDGLANSPRYRSAVQSLTCYKGIKNVFALTMRRLGVRVKGQSKSLRRLGVRRLGVRVKGQSKLCDS